MILLAILNIFLAAYGVKRAYHTKSMIIFVWLICFYYSITSIVSLLSATDVAMQFKMEYASNMTLCLIAFLASDMVFNKKVYGQIDCSQLESFKPILTVVEIIFWVSTILTYLDLRNQDYLSYNSSAGHAGWSQTIFQTSCCIIIYFAYRKWWYKLAFAILLVVGMIASTGVRSLLYFILLPIVLYYINNYIHSNLNLKMIFKVVLPITILFGFAVVVVNSLRFGEVKLPETELTDISLDVLEKGGYPHQTYFSLLHYFSGFCAPFVNAINMFGFDMPMPGSFLPPSIPRLNDLYTAQYHAGEAHMPATIFHDFYMSYGYYGCLWGFVVFSWLKLLCNFLQRNVASFFALSSVFGWHIYFIMRGACDTCSSGISYSILIGFLLYAILNRRLIRINSANHG